MSLSDNKFVSESKILPVLLKETEFLADSIISKNAEKIIIACRENKKERTKLDAFLSEYGLDNQEGVALMCLAESILRIPDSKTRDLIISERLSEGKWIDHVNKADSLFVNASTWGLLLAGKVVKTPLEWSQNPNKFLRSIVSKSGEFPIRNAVIAAMHILSQEFVMGRDFKDVKKIPYINESIFSFDMLGEAARNQEQADIYYDSYENAILEVGKLNEANNKNNGVSIKISALCPSYEMRKFHDIKSNLIPKLIALTELGMSKNVEITIDAEEQDRLSLSLDLFNTLALDPAIKSWPGLGIAVQAYGKRSLAVVDWLDNLSKKRDKMHVRLVKGAYWDYEIKNAQVKGLNGYPVFTNKHLTDLNYLVTAKRLIECKRLDASFATHNAHSIASLMSLSESADSKIEFQRLYGMGELLYSACEESYKRFPETTIYCPIGRHKELLPYLVRRLLENGANSSFINKYLNNSIPAMELAQNPGNKISLPCSGGKEVSCAIELPIGLHFNAFSVFLKTISRSSPLVLNQYTPLIWALP